MAKPLDLAGNRYTRLVAVSRAETRRTPSGYYISYWKCVCDCGSELEVATSHLRSGGTTSCGCLNQENRVTHGLSSKPEYRAWASMKSRCTNPNDSAYVYYGARGVGFCDKWKDFFAFYSDMGDKPQKDYTLDRKDPTKDYHPDNCRWASKSQQSQNQSKISGTTSTYKGVTWHNIGKKWAASVKHNKQTKYLGLFIDQKDAALVYDREVIKIQGEDCWLNRDHFPEIMQLYLGKEKTNE